VEEREEKKNSEEDDNRQFFAMVESLWNHCGIQLESDIPFAREYPLLASTAYHYLISLSQNLPLLPAPPVPRFLVA